VAEALRRLPPELIVQRNQRLKRAMDLSMKSEKLPKELREKQTPFEHYLLVRMGGWGGLLGVGGALEGSMWGSGRGGGGAVLPTLALLPPMPSIHSPCCS